MTSLAAFFFWLFAISAAPTDGCDDTSSSSEDSSECADESESSGSRRATGSVQRISNGFEMDDLRTQLKLLVADRHSPEARALYTTILSYVDRRVRSVGRHAASDLLTRTELEEVVGDVLLQLMTGALARFRGNSIPELIGFVRTVTDRRMWRVIKKHAREKHMLEEVGADAMRVLYRVGQGVEQLVEIVPEMPLSKKDAEYLRELLQAGSKAEFARQKDLSRAAVTQRVHRIRQRIEALAPQDRMAVDVWLHHAAREVLWEQAGMAM